jgi:hypothetical protein
VVLVAGVFTPGALRDPAPDPAPSRAAASPTASVDPDDTAADLPHATAEAPFRFLDRSASGDPIGWNPCRPIRYEVNLRYAPPGAGSTVAEAIRRIEEASAFRFTFVGITRRGAIATADADYLDAGFDPRPVLISWLPPSRFSAIAPPRRAAAVGIPRLGRGPDAGRYTSGQILINTGAHARRGWGTRYSLGPLLLHEWGHVLGLAHVKDRDQIMWSYRVPGADRSPTVGLTTFGDGDLGGLAVLSAAECPAGDA